MIWKHLRTCVRLATRLITQKNLTYKNIFSQDHEIPNPVIINFSLYSFQFLHSTGSFLVISLRKIMFAERKKWGRCWTSPSLMQCALWLDLTLQKTLSYFFAIFQIVSHKRKPVTFYICITSD